VRTNEGFVSGSSSAVPRNPVTALAREGFSPSGDRLHE